MRQISSKIVTQILTDELKHWLHVSFFWIIQRYLTGSLLAIKLIFNITQKQNSRVYSGKKISLSWKKPHSHFKRIFVHFFDHKRIVYYKFLALGQTVNQSVSLKVLKELQEIVSRKRSKHRPDKWIINHDSVPAHDPWGIHKFLAKKSITKMNHPLYSPDLAPSGLGLFPKLKNTLKEQRFAEISDIQLHSRKQVPRIFLAMTLLSHKLHSFTRRVL